MLTKDMTVRNYEVQQFTGYPVSSVGAGRWERGQLARFHTVEFRSTTWDLFMYDPTDPLTWNNANF